MSRPILVSDPTQYWEVISGEVELSYSQLINQAPTANRIWILTVNTGHVFSGISADQDGFGFVAILGLGAQVKSIKTPTPSQAAHWDEMKLKGVLTSENYHQKLLASNLAQSAQINLRKTTDQSMFLRALSQLSQLSSSTFHAASGGHTTLDAAVGWVLTSMGLSYVPRTAQKESFSDRIGQINHTCAPYEVGVRPVQIHEEKMQSTLGYYLVLEAETEHPMGMIFHLGQWWMLIPGQPHPIKKSGLPELKLHALGYQLYPPLPQSGESMTKLVLGHSKAALAQIGISSALIALLSSLFPAALGFALDQVIPKAETTLFYELSVGLCFATLGMAVFQWIRGIAVARLMAGIELNLHPAIWNRLLHLPAAFFKQFSVGGLTLRANCVLEFKKRISSTQVNTILLGVFSIIQLMILFSMDAGLTAKILALVFPVAMTGLSLIIINRKRQKIISAVEESISSQLYQVIQGMAKIHTASAKQRFFSLWATPFKNKVHHQAKLNFLNNLFNIRSVILPPLTTLILFIYIGDPGHVLSLGGFLAYSTILGLWIASVSNMFVIATEVSAILSMFERLDPIFSAKPELNQSKKWIPTLNGDIEFNQVSFAYPGLPNVLHDISFTIKPGEFVAIVGPSGCGKSTLLRLILGFETPNSGAIYLDQERLGELDLQSVRRNFGVVLQQSKIFSGDIFSNIVGSLPLTLDDAWAAAKLAQIDEEISAMPMRMYTVINDGSATLSGGQIQRLMIARALAHHPKLLLLDEATSALDNITQEKISKSLKAMNITRLAIAHRLSTIKDADKIIVLDKGRVVQMGTYYELIHEPGVFQTLASRQEI